MTWIGEDENTKLVQRMKQKRLKSQWNIVQQPPQYMANARLLALVLLNELDLYLHAGV